MQFPITPGATYPEALGETPPGVIGNCICPGIAFGGNNEYIGLVFLSVARAGPALVRLPSSLVSS